MQQIGPRTAATTRYVHICGSEGLASWPCLMISVRHSWMGHCGSYQPFEEGGATERSANACCTICKVRRRTLDLPEVVQGSQLSFGYTVDAQTPVSDRREVPYRSDPWSAAPILRFCMTSTFRIRLIGPSPSFEKLIRTVVLLRTLLV